jgi:hypothetical protein
LVGTGVLVAVGVDVGVDVGVLVAVGISTMTGGAAARTLPSNVTLSTKSV